MNQLDVLASTNTVHEHLSQLLHSVLYTVSVVGKNDMLTWSVCVCSVTSSAQRHQMLDLYGFEVFGRETGFDWLPSTGR